MWNKMCLEYVCIIYIYINNDNDHEECLNMSVGGDHVKVVNCAG